MTIEKVAIKRGLEILRKNFSEAQKRPVSNPDILERVELQLRYAEVSLERGCTIEAVNAGLRAEKLVKSLNLWQAVDLFRKSDEQLRIRAKMEMRKQGLLNRIFQGYDGKILRFLRKASDSLDEAYMALLENEPEKALGILKKYHAKKRFLGLAGPILPL